MRLQFRQFFVQFQSGVHREVADPSPLFHLIAGQLTPCNHFNAFCALCKFDGVLCVVRRWLQLRFDFDLTAIRPHYDHSTTNVTIPGCCTAV